MNKRALVILAEGFEDMEAVAPIDVLTRAGVEVTIAGLRVGPLKAAYGTTMVVHRALDHIAELYDAVVLPGGMKNAESLAESVPVVSLVKRHFEAGKLVAAICASPALVLAEAAGLLRGRRATGFPDLNHKLVAGGATVSGELVTADGNIITGMGPGASLPFALMLAEYLVGREVADRFAGYWHIGR